MMRVGGRQIDADRMQLADPAVAHQFTGPPPTVAGAFMAAGLHNAAVAGGRSTDGPPFVH
jgi:hypothetical protein